MIKIKNVLIITLAMFVSSMSFAVSNRSKRRVKTLEKCVLMFEQMETKIAYSCDNVYSLIEECSNSTDLTFLKKLLKSDSRLSFQQTWEQCVDSSKYQDCLKNDDVHILVSFGKMLGKTDCAGQIKNCLAHKKMIQSNLDRAVLENEKRGNLITTLGLIGSLGIIVLLI